MPRARWPNLDITEPYEISAEGDHIVSFASQSWLKRTGGTGTQDLLIQPRNVQIRVGKQILDITGKTSYTGPAATPAVSRRFGAKLYPGGGRSREMNSRGEPRPVNGKRLPQASPDTFQIFQCQDFVLWESPILLEMYKAVPKRPDQGSRTPVSIGPICRHAELFEPVLVLMKLRWLARLHSAMLSFAGGVCSLARYLKGILADSSGCHEHAHSPVPYFDTLSEHLKQSLMAHLGTWAQFVSYVSHHDRESVPVTSARSGAPFGNARASTEIVEQLVDDIFVTWMSQQSAAKYPVEMIMDELDFFQIRRPIMKLHLERLQCWCSAVTSVKYRHTRGAQQQAAHLAVMMDWPSMWPYWQHTKEQVLDMARMVVSHPRTFNTGVRARIAAHLTDDSLHVDSVGAVCPAFADTINIEQKAMIHDSLTTPRDIGNVSIHTIGRNNLGHDLRPPWLVGIASRVQDTSKFHARMATEIGPLEGGTPRLPQIAVKITAS